MLKAYARPVSSKREKIYLGDEPFMNSVKLKKWNYILIQYAETTVPPRNAGMLISIKYIVKKFATYAEASSYVDKKFLPDMLEIRMGTTPLATDEEIKKFLRQNPGAKQETITIAGVNIKRMVGRPPRIVSEILYVNRKKEDYLIYNI
jgi:hypothetical protein